MENKNKINCWNCKYQKIGGETLLGICLIKNKEISPLVVDKGCSKFTTKYKKIKPQDKKEQLSLL